MADTLPDPQVYDARDRGVLSYETALALLFEIAEQL